MMCWRAGLSWDPNASGCLIAGILCGKLAISVDNASIARALLHIACFACFVKQMFLVCILLLTLLQQLLQAVRMAVSAGACVACARGQSKSVVILQHPTRDSS